jgi:hypothetical protein
LRPELKAFLAVAGLVAAAFLIGYLVGHHP